MYRCSRDTCGLRYSVAVGDVTGRRCPLCRAPAEAVGEAYGRQVVDTPQDAPVGPALDVLLDNIRSAWNVGSMLRSADGAGVRRAYLCGVSATPGNPKVAKTALGAERSLPWQHAPDAAALAAALKNDGRRIWALEGGPQSVSLFELRAEIAGSPLVLAVGNEVTGVDPGVLEQCDRVVSLPMAGVKGSLNVAVAFGVAVYFIRYGAASPKGQE